MKIIPIKIPNNVEINIEKFSILINKGNIKEQLKIENGVDLTKEENYILVKK